MAPYDIADAEDGATVELCTPHTASTMSAESRHPDVLPFVSMWFWPSWRQLTAAASQAAQTVMRGTAAASSKDPSDVDDALSSKCKTEQGQGYQKAERRKKAAGVQVVLRSAASTASPCAVPAKVQGRTADVPCILKKLEKEPQEQMARRLSEVQREIYKLEKEKQGCTQAANLAGLKVCSDKVEDLAFIEHELLQELEVAKAALGRTGANKFWCSLATLCCSAGEALSGSVKSLRDAVVSLAQCVHPSKTVQSRKLRHGEQDCVKARAGPKKRTQKGYRGAFAARLAALRRGVLLAPWVDVKRQNRRSHCGQRLSIWSRCVAKATTFCGKSLGLLSQALCHRKLCAVSGLAVAILVFHGGGKQQETAAERMHGNLCYLFRMMPRVKSFLFHNFPGPLQGIGTNRLLEAGLFQPAARVGNLCSSFRFALSRLAYQIWMASVKCQECGFMSDNCGSLPGRNLFQLPLAELARPIAGAVCAWSAIQVSSCQAAGLAAHVVAFPYTLACHAHSSIWNKVHGHGYCCLQYIHQALEAANEQVLPARDPSSRSLESLRDLGFRHDLWSMRHTLKQGYVGPLANGDVVHIHRATSKKRSNKRVPIHKYPMVTSYVQRHPESEWATLEVCAQRGQQRATPVNQRFWNVLQVFHARAKADQVSCEPAPALAQEDHAASAVFPSCLKPYGEDWMCKQSLEQEWLAWFAWKTDTELRIWDDRFFCPGAELSSSRVLHLLRQRGFRNGRSLSSHDYFREWLLRLEHCAFFLLTLKVLRSCLIPSLPSLCFAYVATACLGAQAPRCHLRACRICTLGAVSACAAVALGPISAGLGAIYTLFCPTGCLWWPPKGRTCLEGFKSGMDLENEFVQHQLGGKRSTRANVSALKRAWAELGAAAQQEWVAANLRAAGGQTSKAAEVSEIAEPSKRTKVSDSEPVERGVAQHHNPSASRGDPSAGISSTGAASSSSSRGELAEQRQQKGSARGRGRGRRPLPKTGFTGTPPWAKVELNMCGSSAHRQGRESTRDSLGREEQGNQHQPPPKRTRTSLRTGTTAHDGKAVPLKPASVSKVQRNQLSQTSFLVLQPDRINDALCMARIKNHWCGGQCKHARLPGSDLCRQHGQFASLPYGRVDMLPPRFDPDGKPVASMFVERNRKRMLSGQSLVPERTRHRSGGKRQLWYSRHHFFRTARRLYGIHNLSDLDEEQFQASLRQCHATLVHHPPLRSKLVKGSGPCVLEEIENDDDCVGYNGPGGGRFYQWYTKGQFLAELALQGASLSKCSEFQFEEALRCTSAKLNAYPAVIRRLVPYAGPQSYAHRFDVGRLERTAETRISQQKASSAAGAKAESHREFLRPECWFKCSCGKSRLVHEACVPALSGDKFDEKMSSAKLPDWQAWCSKTQVHARFLAARQNNQAMQLELFNARGDLSADTAQETGQAGDEVQPDGISDSFEVDGCGKNALEAEHEDAVQEEDDDDDGLVDVSSDDDEKRSLYREDFPEEPAVSKNIFGKSSARERSLARTSQAFTVHDSPSKRVGAELLQQHGQRHGRMCAFRCNMLQSVPAQASSDWEVMSCDHEDDAVQLLNKARCAACKFEHHDEVFVLPYDPSCPHIGSDQAKEILYQSRVGRIDQGHHSDPRLKLTIKLHADCASDGQHLGSVKELIVHWHVDDENPLLGHWQPSGNQFWQSCSGVDCQSCLVLPCRLLQPHVAKFDVAIRNEPLQAVRAMHAILGHMVLFRCDVCKEEFPTCHPAWSPPSDLDLHLLRRSHHGVAACNTEVHLWNIFPEEDHANVARLYTGRCRACQVDIESQQAKMKACQDEGVIVPKRSHLNHMDPCFRFPEDDLRQLFDSAGLIESTLVALHHMQVNYITISKSRLHKFYKNVICFEQDFGEFAQRTGLLDGFRVGDRVNTLIPPSDGDVEQMNWDELPAELKSQLVKDDAGRVVFGATVLEVQVTTGDLKLGYDTNPVTSSHPEKWVPQKKIEPRVTMPWHPKKLHNVVSVMLRRSVGRGVVLEGLQVRWDLVKRILEALTKLGPWHETEDGRLTPMHRYYHRGLFDMQASDEKGYKEADGTYWQDAGDARGATPEQLEALRVPVITIDDPEDVPQAASADLETRDSGQVDEKLLEAWLETDLELSRALRGWWLQEALREDAHCADDGGDATMLSFIRAMKVASVGELATWCLAKKSEGHFENDEMLKAAFDRDREELVDCLGFELAIVADRFVYEKSTAYLDSRQSATDPSDEARRMVDELVLGWPTVKEDPVFIRAVNRFVCCFPLEYPMGIADMYEDRTHKVQPADYVQHMLRHYSKAFVNGARGHRVLWALVNTQLLQEARQKCFGVYNTAIKKIGGRVVGLAHVSKAQLREMVEDEQQSKMLVNLIMSIGKDVRSTPMAWAYEGKKLDAAVKHVSWRPPWMRPSDDQHTAQDLDEASRELLLGPNKIVSDEIGLGRGGALWWTLNGKYYLVHDIHRFRGAAMHPGQGPSGDCGLEPGPADAVDAVCDSSTSRNLFLRDNPDIASYMFAFRTELTMRIVMPTIVPHTGSARFLSMARFEVGPNGNPHYHGIAFGHGDHPTIGNLKPKTTPDDESSDEATDVESTSPQSQDDAKSCSEEEGSQEIDASVQPKVYGMETSLADDRNVNTTDISAEQSAQMQDLENQSDAEDAFLRFFGQLVSEWNLQLAPIECSFQWQFRTSEFTFSCDLLVSCFLTFSNVTNYRVNKNNFTRCS